jgi:hypothetical protein
MLTYPRDSGSVSPFEFVTVQSPAHASRTSSRMKSEGYNVTPDAAFALIFNFASLANLLTTCLRLK